MDLQHTYEVQHIQIWLAAVVMFSIHAVLVWWCTATVQKHGPLYRYRISFLRARDEMYWDAIWLAVKRRCITQRARQSRRSMCVCCFSFSLISYFKMQSYSTDSLQRSYSCGGGRSTAISATHQLTNPFFACLLLCCLCRLVCAWLRCAPHTTATHSLIKNANRVLYVPSAVVVVAAGLWWMGCVLLCWFGAP